MAKLPILVHPHPTLFKKAQPVTDFSEKLKALVDDMIDTMLEAPGAGLAAPQVGISRRLFVVNGDYLDKPGSGVAIINPVLRSLSGNQVEAEEGCLSLPGLFGSVRRFANVTCEAVNLQGEPVTFELADWPARIVQHEFDHLEGILFPERMRGIARQSMLRRVQKLFPVKT